MTSLGIALQGLQTANGDERRAQALATAKKALRRLSTIGGGHPAVKPHVRRARALLESYEFGTDPPLPPAGTPEAIIAAPIAAARDAHREALQLPLGRDRAVPIARAIEAFDPLEALARASGDARFVRTMKGVTGMVEMAQHKDGYLGRAVASTQERIRTYFRYRQLRILAACEEAVVEHGTMIGDLREHEIREFLRDLLPQRFSVDKGMVYGEERRTQESDVVIWDSLNYPRIPQGTGFLFFSAAVPMIFEVKSNWDAKQCEDIVTKCRSARDVVTVTAVARNEYGQIETGPNRTFAQSEIRTRKLEFGAIIIRGGQRLSVEALNEHFGKATSDGLPRLTILIESGRVIWVKTDVALHGDGTSAPGELIFYEAGDDALLLFTANLLGTLVERTAHIEHPFYLKDFCAEVLDAIPKTRVRFSPTTTDQTVFERL